MVRLWRRIATMDNKNVCTYDYWKDIIDELDTCPALTGNSANFIISLKENQPRTLSIAQVKWLNDLQERYLA
jgi:hypothetical protein